MVNNFRLAQMKRARKLQGLRIKRLRAEKELSKLQSKGLLKQKIRAERQRLRELKTAGLRRAGRKTARGFQATGRGISKAIQFGKKVKRKAKKSGFRFEWGF